MPVIFRCSSCGSVIYVFERVGQDCFGLPSPTELINRVGGECPKCGKKLRLPKVSDIKIAGRLRVPLKEYIGNYAPSISEGTQAGVLRTASVSQ